MSSLANCCQQSNTQKSAPRRKLTLVNKFPCQSKTTIIIYGIEPLLRFQIIGSLLANQANLILLVVHLLRHMFTIHVGPLGLVITYTCLSALQSAALAFYPKLTTGKTAAQWGRTLTTTTQNKYRAH